MARLAYDGTAYNGFQRQAAGIPTIQEAVENALTTIAQCPITCIGAGRTDTGVHASGQVIMWDMEWQNSTHRLLQAVNFYLSPDVAVQQVRVADNQFHVRFDALSRTYLYRVYTAPARDPLRDRFAWHWFTPLAIETMALAAEVLIGEHDFATFGQPPQGTNTIRHVQAIAVEPNGDEIRVSITANAFLQRMVRSIVGTLVDVGRGKLSLEQFKEAFWAAERSQAGPSAPAHGLTLTHVAYHNANMENQDEV